MSINQTIHGFSAIHPNVVFVFDFNWYQNVIGNDESSGFPVTAGKSVFAREQLFVSGVKEKYSNFVIKCTFQICAAGF